MPDDDQLLGQNEVDVRNEARKHPYWDSVLSVFACPSPEHDWIADQQAAHDIAEAIETLRCTDACGMTSPENARSPRPPGKE